MQDANWPGSRWWRFDLHVHTPASHDYRGSGTGPAACRDLLLAALNAGIAALGITDHNSPNGVPEMQRALAALQAEGRVSGADRLVLFPGVEMTTASGCHMLALFPPSTGRDEVAALLTGCGIRPAAFGSPSALARCSEVELCHSAGNLGGLVVGAHVDGPRGFVRALSGEPRLQILNCPALSALEVTGDDATLAPFIDGTAPGIERALAFTSIEGSDAHRPEEVGQRFTWLRMTRPSFDSLKLALEDREQILLSSKPPSDPNAQHASDFIESISIRETKYMGRPQPIEIRFSPWINAIIGSRGTGKSTTIALLRTALRRGSDMPAAVKREYDELLARPMDRRSKGILLGDTATDVVFRRAGTRYRIHWDAAGGGPSISVQQPASDEWEAAPGEVKDRFPVRIFSQNELFFLADDAAALLGIIDEAPEVRKPDWDNDWKVAVKRVLDIRRALHHIDSIEPERNRLLGRLDDVSRKLALFETASNRDILASYQRLQRQRAQIQGAANDLARVAATVRSEAERLKEPDLALDRFDPTQPFEAEVHALLAQAAQLLGRISENFVQAADEVEAMETQLRHHLTASAWADEAARIEGAFAALEDRARTEGTDLASYGPLVQERRELERQLGELDAEAAARERLRGELATAKHDLLTVRERLTQARQDFLQRVLGDNPFVRIRAVPFGNTTAYADEVWERLGIDRFEEDRAALLQPVSDASTVEARLAELEQFKETLLEITATGRAARALRDRRFAATIRRIPVETIDAIETTFPEDLLQTSFRTGVGSAFQPIEQGSPGQKSSALLAFFMSYGSEPLILDQPENDLDNELVATLVVGQLKAQRLRRQVIVVTHNANVVVNGDADAILTYRIAGGQTRVAEPGGLQDTVIREEVCRILEGGRQALEARYRRIVDRRA